MSNVISSAHIRAALRERYPCSSHALMFEVGNGTGHTTSRHADAVAMGLWPSRGLEVEGIEIKVSRSDWKRELADHAKAEAVQRFCDRWWIAAPKGLIPPAELPATWGLLELDDKAMRQKVPAPKLEAQPLSRTFLAAMLRRASEADAEELKLAAAKQLQALRAADELRLELERKTRFRDATEAMEKVKAIEAATGLNLSHWCPSDDIISAIKFALRTGIAGSYGGLDEIARHAERLAAEIRSFAKEGAG